MSEQQWLKVGEAAYGMRDLARLEQVAALRAGLGLEEIAGAPRARIRPIRPCGRWPSAATRSSPSSTAATPS